MCMEVAMLRVLIQKLSKMKNNRSLPTPQLKYCIFSVLRDGGVAGKGVPITPLKYLLLVVGKERMTTEL